MNIIDRNGNVRKRTKTMSLLRRDFSYQVRPKVAKGFCELCGVDDEKLEVHHIYRFSEQVDQVFEDLGLIKHRYWDAYTKEEQILIRRNMIGIQLGPESFYRTLCTDCHERVHSYDNIERDDLYE